MLRRVISGGQTGADLAGLLAARKVGIETGGWIPKGWLTELGPRPVLKKLGLREHTSDKYPPRTKQNILDSDATLIIAEHLDRGSALTRDLCYRLHKPVFHISLNDMEDSERTVQEVVHWLEKRHVQVINIAGNRESRSPGLQRQATTFLTKLFSVLQRMPTTSPLFRGRKR